MWRTHCSKVYLCVLAATAMVANIGCRSVPRNPKQEVQETGAFAVPAPHGLPRELSKVVLPEYRIEPPDILMVDAIHIVPRQPYHLHTLDVIAVQVERTREPHLLHTLDVLAIHATGALSDAPISGNFQVEPEGFIRLVVTKYVKTNAGQQPVGMHDYGSIQVGGMTVAEAENEIERHLRKLLKDIDVSVGLASLAAAPIAGNYPVELGGTVNLGPRYGTVRVAGLTIEEAKQAIEQHLQHVVPDATVSVGLVSTAAKQQIAGEHLVGPDGTVTLGTYGNVSVVGLTLVEAKLAIENHLSQFLDRPEVSVDVYAYNSKMYYVITQGAGTGDQVIRFPVTGNETVLDAISQVNGLQSISSKKIWIARPTETPGQCIELPVSWDQITAKACACSNYQIFPGDRVFIAEDKLVALDSGLAKFIAPVERIMGFTILGVTTATRLSGNVLRGGGNPSSSRGY